MRPRNTRFARWFRTPAGEVATMLGMSTILHSTGKTALLGLCLFLPLAGCGDNSGTKPPPRPGAPVDEYVEGPLTESAKRYEHVLEVSNAIVQKLQAKDAHGVYADFLAPELQKEVPETTFLANLQKTESLFGPIKTFKPMQWLFQAAPGDGVARIASTKIVEHERGMLRYTFTFLDDGKFEKVIGFDAHPRKGTAVPGAPAPAPNPAPAPK